MDTPERKKSAGSKLKGERENREEIIDGPVSEPGKKYTQYLKKRMQKRLNLPQESRSRRGANGSTHCDSFGTCSRISSAEASTHQPTRTKLNAGLATRSGFKVNGKTIWLLVGRGKEGLRSSQEKHIETKGSTSPEVQVQTREAQVGPWTVGSGYQGKEVHLRGGLIVGGRQLENGSVKRNKSDKETDQKSQKPQQLEGGLARTSQGQGGRNKTT